MIKRQPVGIGMVPCETPFGSFIRNNRLTLKMTQEELARKIGTSQRKISLIEIGVRKRINVRKLKRLARALSVDIERLRSLMPGKQLKKPKKALGRKIEFHCQRLGLSFVALSGKLDKPIWWLDKIMTARRPKIDEATMQKLSDFFGIETSELSRFLYKKKPKARLDQKMGRAISTQRKHLGMSQRELARRMNITHQYVSRIETGKDHLFNSPILEKIAFELQMNVSGLQALQPKKKPPDWQLVERKKAS